MASSSEKRCLYEVLGLSRDCSPDDIRSAYKKLALQRHPDKLVQSGVPEPQATAAFQELVNAYEVLSDPRERAWYDSHRSQILFSSSASTNSSSASVPDLFSFFSNSVYSGYSDSGRGFYKVYGDVFDKIYSNEINFANTLGLPLPKQAPLMGNLQSPYTQVSAFYNYWLGFVTVMDFCWVDQYDAMAGPNRKSRRLMEEENKKIRKKARKEYNETVRGLAEFVKKRDKRVIDMQVKRNEEMERKKEEERQRKKELERLKAERAKKYEEPGWAKVDEVEDEDDYNAVEEVEKNNELYCIVCCKKFKSEKQWKNHEQSKKHKEKVAVLRETFSEEDREHEEKERDAGDGEEGDDVGENTSSYLSAADGVNELQKHFEDSVQLQEVSEEAQPSNNEEVAAAGDDGGLRGLDLDLELGDDEESVLEAMVFGQRNRKKGQPKHQASEANKSRVDIDGNVMEFMEYNDMKGARRSRGGRRRRGRRQEEEESLRTDMSGAEESNQCNDDLRAEEPSSHPLPEREVKDDEDITSRRDHKLPKHTSSKKISSKKDDATKSKGLVKGRKQKGATKVSGNTCEKCGEEFESRSKLHKHLGERGHASLRSR